MPRDGLAIIESKSKVRYSRSRAIEPRVSTNAPLSTSTPSNSFEFQQLAASLEDKMDIRMSRLEKMISEMLRLLLPSKQSRKFVSCYGLNPLYAIKECSSCGSLYTKDCGCSEGSLEDKILVPEPLRNCAKCGTPVDGSYCRGCALLRKKFKEDLFAYCVENFQDFEDTSESSDDNTNVVNAPQEPIVVNQNPGDNSSPSPLHIDHCCHECES
ncbi:hypothetical protein Tco_1032459 [Tanacetum coccineum]|uniref:Uncharacterized protein n=1 Tax=Tanacetum coccineum TaxID=301880 RepID=A0ABQ5GCY9_9ASTR